MKTERLVRMVVATGALVLAGATFSLAYPPAVGILGKASNCLSCHVDNGPWKDDGALVIDIVDRDARKSVRRPDKSFLIEVRRGEVKTLLTVIGLTAAGGGPAPNRNAWLYVDPKTIGSSSLAKFAPGWEVNLPMSCRIVGDSLEGYEGARVSVLPMSLRPSDAAQDGELVLQVMLTRGEAVKGRAKEGMIASYFERKVKLRVVD